MSREVVALLCVGAYLLTCLLVGARAYRRTRDQRDFFMAGRRLGVLPLALGLFASNFSGFAFVGGPGLVYRYGLSSLWMLICAPLSVLLAFTWLGPRLRGFAAQHDALSLPEVLGVRYRSRTVRGLAALVVLAGVIGYFAVQVLTMARVAKGLWPPDAGVPSLEVLIAAATGVLVLYCALGGVLASIYTDVLQGIVMVTASVAVAWAVATSVPGGFPGIVETLEGQARTHATPFGVLGATTALGWFFLFGFGAIGQPHYVSKFMMARSARDLGKVLPLLLLAMTLASAIWITVGLAMKAEALRSPELARALSQPDDASVLFLRRYTSPALMGLVFAGLFAAIMSSADAFLNMGAASLTRDLPEAFGFRPSRGGLLGPRLLTLGLGALAAVLALSWEELIAILGLRSWALFAAAIAPALGFGLRWRGPGAACALASMAVGAGVALGNPPLPGGLSASVLAFVAALLTWLVVASLEHLRQGAAKGRS